MNKEKLRRCIFCGEMKEEYYENAEFCEDCAKIMDVWITGGSEDDTSRSY